MRNHTKRPETTVSPWHWLYKTSGAAAVIAGALFLAAIIALVTTVLAPGTPNGWLSLLENNWLVVLFKLNAAFSGVQFDQLYGLNLLDISILALVAVTYLGLYAALRRTSKIWSIVAAIQPFLGIVIFVATKQAGRSTVMGAGLVISLVMLRGNIFGKVIAFVGILASVLLLAGDVGTRPDSHSNFIAILVGIGYALLTAWLFLIGRKLLRLEQRASLSGPQD